MDWLPGSDRLGDSDWWWDTAFDGIASSLLTAALAFAGIWWTLRHDRHLKSTSDLEAESRSLHGRAEQIYRSLGQKDLDLADAHLRLTFELTVAIVHAADLLGVHAEYAHALRRAYRHLEFQHLVVRRDGSEQNLTRYRSALDELTGTIQMWLAGEL